MKNDGLVQRKCGGSTLWNEHEERRFAICRLALGIVLDAMETTPSATVDRNDRQLARTFVSQ